MLDSINVVLYVAIPVSFCIFAYAGPLNYTLYYSENLELCTFVVQWMALEGFLSTLAPLVTNLMVSLELRKNVLKNLAIGVLIKGVLLIPFVWIMGIAGAVISSFIGTGYIIYKNLKEIQDVYHISYRKTLIIVVRILIGLFALWITSILLSKVGLYGVEGSNFMFVQDVFKWFIKCNCICGSYFVFKSSTKYFSLSTKKEIGCIKCMM